MCNKTLSLHRSPLYGKLLKVPNPLVNLNCCDLGGSQVQEEPEEELTLESLLLRKNYSLAVYYGLKEPRGRKRRRKVFFTPHRPFQLLPPVLQSLFFANRIYSPLFYVMNPVLCLFLLLSLFFLFLLFPYVPSLSETPMQFIGRNSPHSICTLQ